MKKEDVELIDNELFKLEGIAQGLTTFHSRLAWYIDQRITKIRNTLGPYRDPFSGLSPRREKGALHDLDEDSKETVEKVEIQVEEDTLKGKIEDRKIIEEIEGPDPELRLNGEDESKKKVCPHCGKKYKVLPRHIMQAHPLD